MSEFKVIEIKKNILEDNDREADVLRSELKADRTFLLNLMSSPGSGKTTTLVRTIGALKDEMRIGVMEADIDSDVDADTIAQTGAKAIQIHTGGMCHLDADMTRQGIESLETKGRGSRHSRERRQSGLPCRVRYGSRKERHDLKRSGRG